MSTYLDFSLFKFDKKIQNSTTRHRNDDKYLRFFKCECLLFGVFVGTVLMTIKMCHHEQYLLKIFYGIRSNFPITYFVVAMIHFYSYLCEQSFSGHFGFIRHK